MFNDYALLELHNQKIDENRGKAEKQRLLDKKLPKRVRRRKILLYRPEL